MIHATWQRGFSPHLMPQAVPGIIDVSRSKRLRGTASVSIPGTCFTKQTGDKVYTMAEKIGLEQMDEYVHRVFFCNTELGEFNSCEMRFRQAAR
jgi:hypothetical protein